MNLRQLDAWLRLAADRLHDQATTLTQLDQAIGDGDHGINMDRGFTAVVALLDGQAAAPDGDSSGQAVGSLLRQAGQTLIKTVGGASGPLYGTAFLRAAVVYSRAESPSIADTVIAMKAAAEGIGALGRSTPGEKTMLDALVPAVMAAQAALDAGEDDRAVLAAARDAAEAGAQATIPMRATKGRASYLGERSIGHQDPGATSAALLVSALADVMARVGRRHMAQHIIQGRAGSSGAGIGRLVRVWATDVANAATPAGTSARVEPAERQREQERLREALDQAAQQLARLAEDTRARAGVDTAAIFEAQALFVKDPALVEQALAAIAEEGLGAADAIAVAAANQAAVLAGLEDEYFRARAADIRDVGKRVAGILDGRPRPALHTAAGDPAVLAADDLDASLVAELRPGLVAGVALAGGAPTGHAAIVARALGIPLALGLGAALLSVPEGEEVIVDGTRGRLLIAPDPTERLAVATDGPTHAAARLDLPPLTLPVVIEGNAGSVREVEQAAAAGAYGIGLLRTELLFLGRTVPPGLDEQRALYRRIRAAMPDGPVVYRTLDVGGDKPAGYRPAAPEANPALGVRGVRLGLRQPDLLEVQLRALLESAPDRPLHVMFPMVATLEEVREARVALERAALASQSAGLRVSSEVHVGIMIEVPAAALMADALAPAVDFFSIGTNDLVQYTMAADRTSAELADLATAFQPAALRLVGGVCRAARAHGRPVAVCGEAAASPLLAPLLVGLGVTHLSVAAHSVRDVRKALATLDLDACRAAGDAALSAHTSAEVQRIAEAFTQAASAA